MRAFCRVGYRRTSLMILSVALPVAVAACTTSVQQPPAAGVVAQLSVDRFLAAANERDVVTMGRIFGTVDGPISDTGSTFGCFFKKIGSWFGGNACRKQRDVQVQMAAIASVLKHDDYKIVREEPVAGRLNEATRVYVNLTTPDRDVVDVPFVVVRSKGGQWLVEEVDLKKVMGGG
jgi:hypothetical protein